LTSGGKPGLRDAYGVSTPADNIRLYARWAASYEQDFVAANGYVLHRRVAEQLAGHQPDRAAPVLDVGCGTGIGGMALRELGFRVIDGVDISGAMLGLARSKHMPDGSAVYRGLYEADLTGAALNSVQGYRGIVTAGTFTHGHLGPASLQRLWQVASPGAVAAIGINARHYAVEGFASVLNAAATAGSIDIIEIVEVDIYERPPADLGPENRRAKVAVCRVR